MSHITRLKTQIVVADYLRRALDDLGLAYEEGGTQHVRSFAGRLAEVDIRVATPRAGFAIGFGRPKTADGAEAAYELVADWWGIPQPERTALVDGITRRYAYHAAREKLESQGFHLVSEEQSAGGEIRLLLRRTA